MKRSGAFLLACACVLTLAATLASPAAASGPSITISSPRPYQVVQRGAHGRGRLLVAGHCTGLTGSVRVRWAGGPSTVLRCDRNGVFGAWLAGLPAGQGDLEVRSVTDPAVSATCPTVGVGDIYVIAGQSNASGRGRLRFTYSNPTLHATMFGNDDRWQDLQDPVDSPVGQVDGVSRDGVAGGSVWPGVATELMAADGVPVAFVPCARGNTDIARWLPHPEVPVASRTLFGSMARRIAAVGGRVRAVLFWQGERDARKSTPGRIYEARLRSFAAAVFKQCGAPLVVAQIGDYRSDWYTAPAVDAIRMAQQRAWGHVHVVQGPVLYDVDLEGDVHFKSRDAVEIAARRWAAAILGGVLRRPTAEPPHLLRAAYDGDRTIRLTIAAGADPLVPGSAGGFVVTADGAAVAIDDAEVTGPGAVTLTLAAPASGTLEVSLGAGRSAAGAAVPAESSAWRLPMLMFVDRPAVRRTP